MIFELILVSFLDLAFIMRAAEFADHPVIAMPFALIGAVGVAVAFRCHCAPRRTVPAAVVATLLSILDLAALRDIVLG